MHRIGINTIDMLQNKCQSTDWRLTPPSKIPCRKSRRLLFKNTVKANTVAKKSSLPESESTSPYGRLVELIDPKLVVNPDNADFLTKCLFLGSLNLSVKEASAPIKIPASVFNVPSLKHLCILNIVKRKKHEYVQKELEYFRQIEIFGSGEYDDDDCEGNTPWHNFEKFITNSIKMEIGTCSSSNNNTRTPLEECVEKVTRCGTIITLSNSSSSRRSHGGGGATTTSRKRPVAGQGWFSWGEHMIKTLQIDKSISIVVEQARSMVEMQRNARKIIHSKRRAVLP